MSQSLNPSKTIQADKPVSVIIDTQDSQRTLSGDLEEIHMTPDGDLSNAVYYGNGSIISNQASQFTEISDAGPSLPMPGLPGTHFSRLEINEEGAFHVSQQPAAGWWSSATWGRYFNGLMSLMCLSSDQSS